MKALMIATRPEWTRKIINGEKDLEFRPYAIQKGTRVLVYESLGKFIRTSSKYNHKGKLTKQRGYHEGRGKVVLEFTVGECIHLAHKASERIMLTDKESSVIRDLDNLLFQGFEQQPYAHTITDLIVYDEPQPITNYVGWNYALDNYKYCIKRGYRKGTFEKYLNEISGDKEFGLRTPPRGRVWIYMEEER
jgi:hypothetical protein